jgi:hypothetical protein
VPSKILTFQAPSGGLQDSLDGVPLKEGEYLHIRWPGNPGLQLVRVSIDTVHLGVLVAGEAVSVECTKAFIKLPVFGDVAKVYLNGFEARRA